jgi:hypothetical protein
MATKKAPAKKSAKKPSHPKQVESAQSGVVFNVTKVEDGVAFLEAAETPEAPAPETTQTPVEVLADERKWIHVKD